MFVSFFLYCRSVLSLFFFFFNDTATTEIYTLSLHDALPICAAAATLFGFLAGYLCLRLRGSYLSLATLAFPLIALGRSEEHTSELQSLAYLVCRLLLEKKKQKA